MALDETTRLAAHALIDFTVGWSEDAGDANQRAYDANVARLNEIGAVTGTFDEQSGNLELQIAPLLNGAVVTISVLVALLARERGVDREDVVVGLRDALDG